jgi:hypothetical protein
MPTPSLLIVPARFKTGKMYSQIPTSGAGDFTVTRATIATRVNASGLIESVASGIPRLDYFASGGTVGCPALLVEPSGSNLALQSENFGTTWTTDGTTVTINSISSPDGTTTADTIVASGTTGRHDVNQLISVSSGTTYSVSIFCKKKTTQYIYLSSATAGAQGLVVFDFDSGTFTQQTTWVASVQSYGSGWFRISARFVASSTASARIRFGLTSNSTSDSSTLTTSDDTYFWGAQLETGSVATSYIPTTTASVTRNADIIRVSGAVSGSIGQTEGTLYAEVDFRNEIAAKCIMQVDNGSTDNRLFLGINASPNRILSITSVSGVGTTVTGSVTTGVHKIAVSYVSGSQQVYLDGSFLVSGTSALPTVNLTNFSIGARIFEGAYGVHFNDRIRAAALYTTRLTNAQLAALTAP